jgi:GTP-binding protein
MKNIRNVAIIAHVDHGKTTLVDALLKQSKTQLRKDDTGTLIMDSNELERERGITIFSKNASVIFGDTKINIIDTPGHADFGGEVERVLTMADGCLLLVDAKEGPMPQTRFVLRQALRMKHKIIVVINKIDKPDARISEVINEVFDLFIELGADEDTAIFPIVYASSKEGKAGLEPDLSKMTDITPVFDAILEHIPAPRAEFDKPLQMLVSNITSDTHRGRIAIGRVLAGKLINGGDVIHINRQGEKKKAKITSLTTFVGLAKVEVAEVDAGDIAAISGIGDVTIGDTIADTINPEALPILGIEEPTIRMHFMVNSSPFAGREGEFKTSRQVRDRLFRELETDVALKVEDGSRGDWIVSGRGELHLAILIERLRREGYEFSVSRPQVITKVIDGVRMIPFERVFVETPEQYSGSVMSKMGERHAEVVDMKLENGTVFMEFIISTRELFGYRSELMTDTKGMGIINTNFLEFRKDNGFSHGRDRGSLVAHETGTTSTYGLVNSQERGVMFIGPGVSVYKGQVVGQNSRSEDIHVNVCREKQLSNMRSKGDGTTDHFDTPKIMGLEDALEYIDETELVEVTPKNIRIRKAILDEVEARRKKSQGITA